MTEPTHSINISVSDELWKLFQECVVREKRPYTEEVKLALVEHVGISVDDHGILHPPEARLLINRSKQSIDHKWFKDSASTLALLIAGPKEAKKK